MLTNKLKQHLESTHTHLQGNPRDFFVRKLRELEHQTTALVLKASILTKALLASYMVAYRIAKCKKPHTIAEELILPATVDMVTVMIGKSVAKEIKNVPLSNSTVSRRIHDMAEDINAQIVGKLSGLFAIQLDEAMDSNDDAQLICYAVCTHGARAMSGQYGGLLALIQTKAPSVKWTHYDINRETLAAKNVTPKLSVVMDSIIKVVNYIKTRPVKSRLFHNLCEEMRAEHTSLIYYCNSR
ncbi:SCAN domain-containing protein 3-like [Diabrotica undecimpunctata]|uniref:SCAN domain-containing protein 3-like n=1 Tax=Diabrotica undecimpunctata TaxID=50387 RepID=UPI003B63D17F